MKVEIETYSLPEPVNVFGFVVKEFPAGIEAAFDSIISKLPNGDPRPYYGISWCTDEGIVYQAAALETYEGEGEKLGYQRFQVEKGEYLSTTLRDWRDKTDTVKDVFTGMMKDERADKFKPCVELYKDDTEMRCLVKCRQPEHNKIEDNLQPSSSK